MRLSPHEMAWCLLQAGFTGADIVIGVAVGLAESKGDTDALGHVDASPNFDHGVWQISGKWHGEKFQQYPNWRDPLDNARLARLVFLEAGSKWTAWTTFKNGSHLAWMDEGKLAAAAPFRPAYAPDYRPNITVPAPVVKLAVVE